MGIARGVTLHSRVVAWLKVILPLIAIAILSTLFLVSRTIDPSDAIPYAEVDVEDRIREPRMTAPSYAGVTKDGTSISLVADTARPAGTEGAATADAVTATLTTPDGATTLITAATAALDSRTRRLDLGGGVEVVTAQGYRITTDSLSAALDRTRVESTGAISADGPLGRLDAGHMALSQRDEGYVLLFQKGVKLVYLPQGAN